MLPSLGHTHLGVCSAHTCYGERAPPAAAAANESEAPGTGRGRFKSAVSRLDKGLKVFRHSCAAPPVSAA